MKSFFVLCMLIFLIFAAQSQIVCIDAGHGGSDPGASGWGLKEKDITLTVAQLVYNSLKSKGWSPRLTRTGDQTVSLGSRVSFANSLGAKFFVSIHCNAYNKVAHGTETYCYRSGSSKSFNLRDRVNPKVVRALGTYNRGCKTAGFYVIKYTNMPAILCELAFIDNQSDSAKLGNSSFRQKAAEAIVQGLEECRYDRDYESSAKTELCWSVDGKRLLPASLESQANYRQVSALAKNGQIWVTRGGEKLVISDDSDVFFSPSLSPDKSKVVYQGLVSGLYVCNTDGSKRISLGAGNNPCWSADGKSILFELTCDNGQEIISGDIWMAGLCDPKQRRNLTEMSGLIAQHPMASPDGKHIAFSVGKDVFVAELREDELQNPQKFKIDD